MAAALPKARRAQIDALTPGTVHIFTDGACTGNPGPAGCGAVLVYNGRTRELSHFLGHATNNIAELTALKRALELVKDRSLPVRVYADSEYTIGVLTRDWKIKANAALIAEIRELLDQFEDIELEKVPGHAGNALNVRADALARQAIAKGVGARGG